MKKFFTFAGTVALCVSFLACSQQQEGYTVDLYDGDIPNSIAVPDEEYITEHNNPAAVSHPTLTVFLPKKVTSASAVVVCPGGGYSEEWIHNEGEDVARQFNEHGMVAFVLKYRLPSEKWCVNKSIAPLQDAQRAIQYARQHASELGFNPDKVGIIGFSAGGHLAGSAAILGGTDYIDNPSGLKLRPDFALLIYPKVYVVPGKFASRLVGEDRTDEEYAGFSLEKQVDEYSSPICIVHASDDTTVPVTESTDLFNALKSKGHNPALLIPGRGNHGLGDKKEESIDWCIRWMAVIGF